MESRIFYGIIAMMLPSIAFAQSLTSMVDTGRTQLNDIVSISQEVGELMSDARSSNSSDLMECIATKQASIGALRDISQSAFDSLQTASTVERAEYELRKITLATSKARQFKNDAQKCVAGASLSGDNATESTTQVIADLTNVVDNFNGQSTLTAESGQSYSFDSSNSTATTGADSINPPPDTSPY